MRGRNLIEHVLLSDGRRIEARRLYKGCWRITLNPDDFGQVKREGRMWLGEVRDTNTGNLLRYAGLWHSRRAAIEELMAL
jgi:hypothetical protein